MSIEKEVGRRKSEGESKESMKNFPSIFDFSPSLLA